MVIKKISISVYDFDVKYGKPIGGEVKGALVSVPYIGTIVVPVKNLFFPEGEKKRFTNPYKGHEFYKKGFLTILVGNNSNNKEYEYQILLKDKKRYKITGNELAKKLFELSKEGISYSKDGRPKIKKVDYGMVYSEYDTESKTEIKKEYISKIISDMELEESNKVSQEFNQDEFNKELNEIMENDNNSREIIDSIIDEINSLDNELEEKTDKIANIIK